MTVKKCLSLKQPYAQLVVSGKKTIELRKWNTKFRGEFLVHASKIPNKEACERNKIDPVSCVKGAVIGKVVLYDVKAYPTRQSFLRDRNKHFASKDFTEYKYGFVLRGAKKFRKPVFIPCKLRFFDVNIRV